MVRVIDYEGEVIEFPGTNVSVVEGEIWIMDSDDGVQAAIPEEEWVEFTVMKADRRHGKRAGL